MPSSACPHRSILLFSPQPTSTHFFIPSPVLPLPVPDTLFSTPQLHFLQSPSHKNYLPVQSFFPLSLPSLSLCLTYLPPLPGPLLFLHSSPLIILRLQRVCAMSTSCFLCDRKGWKEGAKSPLCPTVMVRARGDDSRREREQKNDWTGEGVKSRRAMALCPETERTERHNVLRGGRRKDNR